MLVGKIIMGLRGAKILNAQESWINGPDCYASIASDTANQAIQEVVKLKHCWWGSPVMSGLLGIKPS